MTSWPQVTKDSQIRNLKEEMLHQDELVEKLQVGLVYVKKIMYLHILKLICFSSVRSEEQATVVKR